MGEAALQIKPERQKRLKLEQKLARAKTRQALALSGQIKYRKENEIEFFTRPNPRQEELLEAWDHPRFKVFTFTGGNRIGKCVLYQTLIDTPSGQIQAGKLFEVGKPFDIYAFDGKKKVVAKAEAPFKKDGLHKCYRIEMNDGQIIECADHHRILTQQGYVFAEQLATSFHSLQETSLDTYPSVHVLNVPHSTGIASGSQDRYFEDFHQYDGKLLLGKDSDRSFVPLQADAQQRDAVLSHLDDPAYTHTSILQSIFAHLSTRDGLYRTVGQFAELLFRSFYKFWLHAGLNNQFVLQPTYGCGPQFLSNNEFYQSASHASCSDRNHDYSYLPPLITDGNHIKDIKLITTRQEVYDFTVPKHHNYFAGGLVHHNTTIGAIIAIATMRGRWPWNNLKLTFPHNWARKIRYIGQDWEKHIKSVIVPALKKWWPARIPVKVRKNQHGIEAYWEDEENGSSLEIMSNKQDVDLHEGWEGDLIVYDEPPKRDIRVANARGLIDRQGRELFCATLLKEAWIDREVIKAKMDDGRPDMSIFNTHGEIYDNVGYGLTAQGVADYEKKLTDEEKEARLKGIPSYMSGLICKNYKRQRNVIEPFAIPTHWPVDVAIDIHPRKPQALLFIATDERNFRYLFHEIQEHGSGADVGDWIIRFVKRQVLRVNQVICDPLAKGDSNNENTTFDKIADKLFPYDIILETATKDKDSGIIEINNHLLGPNKMPSMFVFNTCIHTVDQMESWMYGDDGKPSKENDDFMENLYRLLLLNTEYVPPDSEEEEEEVDNDMVNPVTGY